MKAVFITREKFVSDNKDPDLRQNVTTRPYPDKIGLEKTCAFTAYRNFGTVNYDVASFFQYWVLAPLLAPLLHWREL